jgi:upstream activation factor subunit UAF30
MTSQSVSTALLFAPQGARENRELKRLSPGPGTSTTFLMERIEMATAKKGAAKKAAAKKKAPAKKAAKKAPAKKAAKKAPAKKAAKKAPAKKAAKKAAKKVAKKKAPAKKRAPNPAFMKAMTPSDALAAIIGKGPYPRTEVTKRVWDYIKKNKLQDAVNRRMINADEKLREIFKKAQASMFEMTKMINAHLKP